jgi:hypothetical protein
MLAGKEGTMLDAAGITAAAAAAAMLEEEEMTPYTSKDLAEDWEFKILRCVTGKFRNPVWLHSILEEEARAGWKLVEKFDDTRVRLRRPASARAGDAALDFDPHRTWVGMSQVRFAILIFLATLGGAAALVLLFVMFVASSHGSR